MRIPIVAVACAVAWTAAGADIASTAYVRDGLLAQWDGIDNAGVGTHDASATGWKDLTGRGRDFAITANGSWESDALVVNGNSAINNEVFSALAYQSIEAEYEVVSASASAYILDTGNNCHVLVDHNGLQTWFGCWSGAKTSVAFDSAAGKKHVAATYADSATGTGPSLFYRDGAAVSPAQNGDWWGIAGTKVALGYQYSNNRLPANVRLHALRLYGRMLTPVEIAYNNALDRIRFDGVAPATAFAGLTMPEGYSWDGENLVTPPIVNSVAITVDRVQQRHPWNGLVDIDYTITRSQCGHLDPATDRLEFILTDNATQKKTYMRTFAQFYEPRPLSEEPGQHRVTWLANADGVTNNFANATVTGAINTYGATYMEIDVANPDADGHFPVTYRSGEPTGGYNADATYKTDVVVLRYIPAGTYLAGSPDYAWQHSSREVQHRVFITKPFWCSIYNVTEAQYYRIMGSKPSSSGDTYPAVNLSWDGMRGGSWPGGTPGSSTVLGVLRTKCRAKDADGNFTKTLAFDLPTEYQWEYACRAGTTTPFNDGAAIATDAAAKKSILKLAVWNSNGETSGIQPVGTKTPNAWGLYDMHGNVFDILLDTYQEAVQNLKQYVDPVGPSSAGARTRRGGNWDTGISYLSSTMRGGDTQGQAYNRNGIRLACPAE